ncbi:histidine kinase [Nostoc sp. CENA543]|nr:histidine kinase [Nostoc sp. CENA543]
MGNGEWGIGDEVDKVDFIPMPNAQCPMPNAPCPMPDARCSMPDAQNEF